MGRNTVVISLTSIIEVVIYERICLRPQKLLIPVYKAENLSI